MRRVLFTALIVYGLCELSHKPCDENPRIFPDEQKIETPIEKIGVQVDSFDLTKAGLTKLEDSCTDCVMDECSTDYCLEVCEECQDLKHDE